MAKEPIIIGNKEFKFKKDAKAFFDEIKNCYQDTDTITNQEHHEHLLDLIAHHPDAAEKIGVGIKRFYRDKAEGGTSCFWIERTDGSNVKFSVLAAING
jgi:hypothetical protein